MKSILYILCVILLAGCPGVDAPGGKKESPDTPKVNPKVTPKDTPGKGEQGTPKVTVPTESEKKAATEKLLTAVKAGDVSKVKEALTEGADKDAKDSAGWTVLMWAAWNNHEDTVRALIDDGADVNALSTAGSSVLKLATVKGHGAIVTLLLNAGATGAPTVPTEDEKTTATDKLFKAVEAKGITRATRFARVNEALEAGAPVDAKDSGGRTALIFAARFGYMDTVQALIDKGADVNAKGTEYGTTALRWAALEGHTEVVKVLIDKGADVNTVDNNGLSVLKLVTGLSPTHADIEELLIAAGATGAPTKSEREVATAKLFNKGVYVGDLTQVNEAIEAGADVNGRDSVNWTPLMRAGEEGYTDIAKVLIDKGADVNGKDAPGWTALMHAAKNGHTDVAKLLIDKGADVNAKRWDGETALMFAALHGHTDIVKALIAGGVDVNALNKKKERALLWAKVKRHKAIIKALKAAGATR